MKSTRMLATAGMSLGLAMALQSGCAQKTAVTQAPTANLEAAQPTGEHPAAAEAATVALSGKVVETMQAGGYNYVKVEKDGKSNWAAMSSSFSAQVGDEISLKAGMVMKNFTSKSLNRTFDAIVFTDGPINQEESKAHNMTAAAQGATPAPAPAKISGKVVETMDGGGYTYLNVEKDGKSYWVAIPATKVSVGQEVEVQPGMPMQNFTSKTLNRTFERIDFSSGLVTGQSGTNAATAKGALPAGHPPMGAKSAEGKDAAAAGTEKPKKGHGMMMAQSGQEMVAVSGKVLETRDSGGYTYVQIEEKDGRKIWAAVPTMALTVGQELKLQPGSEMKNFTSKTMNKTFESVIFSSGVAIN